MSRLGQRLIASVAEARAILPYVPFIEKIDGTWYCVCRHSGLRWKALVVPGWTV